MPCADALPAAVVTPAQDGIPLPSGGRQEKRCPRIRSGATMGLRFVLSEPPRYRPSFAQASVLPDVQAASVCWRQTATRAA